MKKRRSLSRDFKWEVAGMVLDQGFSYREVCRQLDLGETGLRRWVEQVQFGRNFGVPKSKVLTDEQKKIHEQGSRINRLEREKAVLKRLRRPLDSTTALLVSDEINRYTEGA
jgi:transposase